MPYHRSEEHLNSSHGSISYAVSLDRKSTRLNSSHGSISYAVFCLKKKKRLNSSHGSISYAVFCLKKKNEHDLPAHHAHPAPGVPATEARHRRTTVRSPAHST